MNLDAFRETRRVRRLAGSGRAGSWGRGEARRRQRRYLRGRWRAFVGVLTGWLILIAVVTAFIPNDMVRGMFIGGGVVGGLSALWFLVVQLTGTAPTMMGDTAEQWTAQELRPLTRLGWRMVNHFALGEGDIDHLLIGPGGVFVLETKWCAGSWQASWMQDRQRAAARQVAASARQVSLWPPFRSMKIRAKPVVVLWTSNLSAQSRAEVHSGNLGQPVRVIDGTVVITGPSVRAWLEKERFEVPLHAAEEVWPAVLEQVRVRDAYEARTNPTPPSAFDLALKVIWSIAAASVSAVLLVSAVSWTNSWVAALVIAGLLVGGGIAVGRWRPSLKWFAWSWSAGSALTTLAALLMVSSAYITDLVAGH